MHPNNLIYKENALTFQIFTCDTNIFSCWYAPHILLLIVLSDGYVLAAGFQLMNLKLPIGLVLQTERVVYHIPDVILTANSIMLINNIQQTFLKLQIKVKLYMFSSAFS